MIISFKGDKLNLIQMVGLFKHRDVRCSNQKVEEGILCLPRNRREKFAPCA